MHENGTTIPNYSHIFSHSETRLIRASYVIVTLLGILSNSIVCYLILNYRHLWTIVNILILNLAVSDIMACISVYPFVFLDIHSSGIRGHGANVLCGITEGLSLFFIGASVSLLTLSILSISRYLVINHPLKLSWRLEKKSMKYIFTLVWLTSTALLMPSSVSFVYNEDKQFCDRDWAPGVHVLTYFIATGILGVIIPFSSLTFTYFTTMYTLWFKKGIPVYRNSGVQVPNSIHVKKRVIVLLGLLIVVYLLCWSPFAVYWLLSIGIEQFEGTIADEIKGIRTTRVVIFIALCNTLLNPMVYAFSNGQLRSAFKKSLRHRKLNSISHMSSFNAPVLTTFSRRYTFNVGEIKAEHPGTFRTRDMTL